MPVRSLDLLDLPSLPRYRKEILILDSARSLTRGNPLGLMAMLSYLNPRGNIHTAVSAQDGTSMLGQVILNDGETSARLTFLAPAEQINGLTPPLLDHLTTQAGEWGALHVLAEVDEDSPAFKALRESGFAMYAWQRVWKLPVLSGPANGGIWRPAEDVDWPSVQALHGQIVPALLHPVENLPKQVTGLVCHAGNGLQAYVTCSSGPQGIWLQPLVPPDAACVPEEIHSLVQSIPGWESKPVYVCVRSYQAWLESGLEELGAEAGPRQAVMVRRLAKVIKETQAVTVVEKALAKAKPAAPVSRIDGKP
jgi:hypothetical protein